MEISVAKNAKLVSKERAMALAKKKALRLKISPEITEMELCYKKIYFLKIIAYAARTPFKPKKTGYVIYYDSLLDKGGLTDSMPETAVMTVADELVLDSWYSLEDFLNKKDGYIEKFILKRYMLKRPDLEEMGIEEIYLPYWYCDFAPNSKAEYLLINAATGKYEI